MKSYLANLQGSISVGTYVKTQTSALGRATQRTINLQTVLGSPLTQFIDVQTPTALAPAYCNFNPVTNRLFVLSVISATPTVMLFNFNDTTGVFSYVGKIVLYLANLAATTHTTRGFIVDDSGATWKVIISTTGSVVINGGTYLGWVTGGLSAFTPGGTTLYAANGSNQQAVYFLQDSSVLPSTAIPTSTQLAFGVGNLATTSWGVALPFSSVNAAINTKVFQFNGTVALPQIFAWDLSGTPTVANITLNGCNAQTTPYGGTSPAAFFTTGAVNPGFSSTVGDPVILMNGTGNVPTAFTATGGTTQTVYFVRDLQLVSGSYYFNLASTSGGAAITPTSSTSQFTIMRAFGTSVNLFYGRTAQFTPALAGTIIQSNSCGYAMPTNAPLSSALNGQDCLFTVSNSTMYLGKASDLWMPMSGTFTSSSTDITVASNAGLVAGMSVISPGVLPGTTIASIIGLTTVRMSTTATFSATQNVVFGMTNWTSFSGCNILGTGVDVVAPTLVQAIYSTVLDRWIYTTQTNMFVIKPHQNAGALTGYFGGNSHKYLEITPPTTLPVMLVSQLGIEIGDGWLFTVGGTTGQRGIIACDIKSDTAFSFTSIISPVLSVPAGTTLKSIEVLEQLSSLTNDPIIYTRSATTAGDAVFNAAAGSWVSMPTDLDSAGVAIGPYFQIKAEMSVISGGHTPPQIRDFLYSVVNAGESSDYWYGSVENTTQSAASPMYVSFMLNKVYSVLPTKFIVNGWDTSGNLLTSFDTVLNPTRFYHSNNNGASWIAWTNMAAFPNTIHVTELRVTVASPPAPADNKVIWSITEA